MTRDRQVRKETLVLEPSVLEVNVNATLLRAVVALKLDALERACIDGDGYRGRGADFGQQFRCKRLVAVRVQDDAPH